MKIEPIGEDSWIIFEGVRMKAESFRDLTIGEILTVQAAIHGQRPYLRLGDELWTYGQAEDEATRLAAGLRQLGLKAGDRFAVLLPNVPAYVIALFGAAKAGLILVPINIRRHPNEIRLRLSKSRPSALLTFSDSQAFDGVDHLAIARQLQPEVPGLEHLIVWGADQEMGLTWEKLTAPGAPAVEPGSGPDEPAAVVHTLGSSGRARGAVLSHGALIRNAAAVAESLASTPADIF
jgi:acyl-CoA synthetase (AMP-forming)/AMP-acid ligase II